jgi:hypothetical protein
MPGTHITHITHITLCIRTKANILGFEVTGTAALLVPNPDDDPQVRAFLIQCPVLVLGRVCA